MNESIKKGFRIGALSFLIGAIAASTVIYFTLVKSGDRRFEAAQTTIVRLEDANRQLQSDYWAAQATASSLAERLLNRQTAINQIAGAVNSMSEGLDESSDLIQRAIDTITAIEHILYH